MAATYPTKMKLAFRSGGICAYPECRKPLVHEESSGNTATIGEAAHIYGENPGAARYVAVMTDDERNAIGNLIYLCPIHHTVIDKLPEDWPADKLLSLKESHEQRASLAVQDAFANIAFPELERAMEWIGQQVPTDNGTFQIVPPDQKIKKNGLTSGSRMVIAAGLAARDVVHRFVEAETQIDSAYPEKLKAGFLTEYHRLRHQGHSGDDLFELMCVFSVRGTTRHLDKVAGLAVLVYLFEICDVFEK